MSAGHLSTSFNGVTNVCCNTSAKQITISYKWVIHDYILTSKNFGTKYASSTFFDKACDKFKWHLKIVRKGPIEENSENFSLYLYLKQTNNLDTKAKVRFFILNSEGKETNVKEFEKLFCKGNFAWGVVHYLKKDTLLNEDNGLLPENRLTIMCEVSFVSDIINMSGGPKSFSEKMVKYKLSKDFGKLFEDSKLSDVILVVADHEFKAHKAVLAARSDVFGAMFEHDFEEAKSNRVVITDVDPEVLKEVLHYIYTDNAPNLDRMARDLLAVADKYALENLKILCEQTLCANLSIETAMDVFMLADRHNAELLGAYTKDFVQTNIKDIMGTQSWKNATNKF